MCHVYISLYVNLAVCFLISYVCLLHLQVKLTNVVMAVTCKTSSPARAEKVAFALPNVCYQVRLPAIWIVVSLVCCNGETFSIYRSETPSFFISHQKTLSILSIIYATVTLDLFYTFIRVPAFLHWLLLDVTFK